MIDERMVWIDLEMTGLDPDENTIIEIATIVTEGDLEINLDAKDNLDIECVATGSKPLPQFRYVLFSSRGK